MPGGPRETLLRAREDAVAQIAALHRDLDGVIDASRSSNADDEHDPEGATIAFERSQVGALVRQARDHLVEIEAALGRLASGTYGTCEGCGSVIAPGRLEARPVARTCISCASTPRR